MCADSLSFACARMVCSPPTLLFRVRQAVDLSQYSAELEQIDARIKDLESRKQAFVSSQRSVARSFILYGLFLWVMIALVCLYLIDFPNRNHVLARFMRIGPVMGWPVMSETSTHTRVRTSTRTREM